MKSQTTSTGVPTHESVEEQMKDSDLIHKPKKFSMPTLPKTSSGRFALVMVPSTAATILAGIMMARPWDAVFGMVACMLIAVDVAAIGMWINEGD